MQLFATFVKYKCNFFNFLVQQKLALVITLIFWSYSAGHTSFLKLAEGKFV